MKASQLDNVIAAAARYLEAARKDVDAAVAKGGCDSLMALFLYRRTEPTEADLELRQAQESYQEAERIHAALVSYRGRTVAVKAAAVVFAEQRAN